MNEIAVIVLTRPTGELFVHRRAASRRTYPGRYGLGAGGKLEPGEAPLAAALRELNEETGISGVPLQPVTIFDFEDGGVSHRVHVYYAQVPAVPNWDEREWSSVAWLAARDVSGLADRGELCPDTKLIWERFSEWYSRRG